MIICVDCWRFSRGCECERMAQRSRRSQARFWKVDAERKMKPQRIHSVRQLFEVDPLTFKKGLFILSTR